MTLKRKVQRTPQDQYVITIPKAIIDLLGIHKGAALKFDVTRNGDILLKRARKKAQLSLFLIVVGFLILGGAIIYWYLSHAQTEFQPEEAEVIQLNQEQIRVKDFVDSCIRSITLEGLEILRRQGGYIYINERPNAEYTTKGWHAGTVSGVPRLIEGDGTTRTAIWITEEKAEFPSKGVMEHELEKYIAQRLPLCTADFKALEDQGYTVIAEHPIAYVTFDTAVMVGVNYPLRVQKNGEWKIDTFEYSVPIDLQKIQLLAQEITVYEFYANYLERQTKRILGYYQGIDENLLPPFYGSLSNTNCEGVTWSLPSVEQNTKTLLQTYIPEIQLEGTSYTPRTSQDAIEQAMIKQFKEDFLLHDYSPVRVQHDLKDERGWEFDIYPRDGDSIKPDKHTGKGIPFLPQFCTYKYAYKYFITYPVFYDIHDPESGRIDLKNEQVTSDGGFTFTFAIKAFLCGNQDRRCVSRPQYMLDVEHAIKNLTGLGILQDYGYCKNSPAPLTLRAVVIEEKTQQPISGAELQYQCGAGQQICSLGRTSTAGKLESKVPSCINGELTIIHPQYAKAHYMLSSYRTETGSITYRLQVQIPMNITVAKIPIREYLVQAKESGDLRPESLEETLDDSEKTLITVPTADVPFISYPTQNHMMLHEGIHEFQTILFGKQQRLPELPNGNSTGAKAVVPSPSLISVQDITREDANRTLKVYAWESPALEDSWEGLLNDYITEDKDLSAQFVYQQEIQGYEGTEPICSGPGTKLLHVYGYDREIEEGPCEEIVPFSIPKEEYMNALRPKVIP